MTPTTDARSRGSRSGLPVCESTPELEPEPVSAGEPQTELEGDSDQMLPLVGS